MAGQRIVHAIVLMIASLVFWPLDAEESPMAISEIANEANADFDFEVLPGGQHLPTASEKNPPEDEAFVWANKAEEEKIIEPIAEPVVIEAKQESPRKSPAMLSQGSYFLQGAMSFIYKLTGFSYTQHTLCLNGKVGGGYFIRDLVAVGANIPSTLKFFPLMMGEIGLSPFFTYFFAIGRSFYPYVGLDITPRYSLQERNFLLSAGVNAGLLLSLSERVALDFGIEPELYFRLNNQQKWKLEVPLGFFGIKAFF